MLWWLKYVIYVIVKHEIKRRPEFWLCKRLTILVIRVWEIVSKWSSNPKSSKLHKGSPEIKEHKPKSRIRIPGLVPVDWVWLMFICLLTRDFHDDTLGGTCIVYSIIVLVSGYKILGISFLLLLVASQSSDRWQICKAGIREGEP